ncbi:MAG: Xaa-Pro peptidase family protein, partial [Pseudomonadota bacterium]
LVASNGRKLDARFESYCDLIDGSGIVPKLRAVKSEEELLFVTKAGEISDEAFLAAKPLIKAGADEGEILSAMQGTVFALGGDYPGNEFIIGSGRDALLCRYKSGRSKLDANDQLTLEWSGAWRRYHAPMMRTVLTGKPQKRHLELYEAAAEALTAVESAMIADNTFGDVFEAHRAVMDKHGLMRHRLNACGYSVGATFTPSWMDMPMFFEDNPEPIVANMSLFAHMIIMDSDTDCAMTLGRTYITGDGPPRSLSTLELDLVIA